MTSYAMLLDRVAALAPLLGAGERPLAERVVEISRALDARPRRDGKLVAADSDHALKRELGRLTEQLGRRASQALPAATLGRAALADLYGDLTSHHMALADCELKLALLGH